jgi:hypothetical protein
MAAVNPSGSTPYIRFPMIDDFPIDEGFMLTLPCFIVRSEDGEAFVSHSIGQGEYAVVILTDEDSLNSYRHDIDAPERGAVKFLSASHLLAALEAMPPQVTRLGFDMRRTNRHTATQQTCLWRIETLRRQLAAQIRRQ